MGAHISPKWKRPAQVERYKVRGQQKGQIEREFRGRAELTR
jgi:hypothetical protein